MNPISVLVVDDEPLARRRLRRLLESRSDLVLVGEARGGREAVESIRKLSPQLIFLDIQMPDWDGIRVLEEVGPERIGAVVFVTAYDRFALRAFDLHAVDYLLKPFSDGRFEQAVKRALARLRREAADTLTQQLLHLLDEYGARASSVPGSGPSAVGRRLQRPSEGRDSQGERLSVRVGRKVRVLRISEIDWLEASGSYVRIHQRSGAFLVRETLASMVDQLPAGDFLRIHRSTAVNIQRVTEVLPFTHRELILVLEDGTRLKMSRTYREAVEARLGMDP